MILITHVSELSRGCVSGVLLSISINLNDVDSTWTPARAGKKKKGSLEVRRRQLTTSFVTASAHEGIKFQISSLGWRK